MKFIKTYLNHHWLRVIDSHLWKSKNYKVTNISQHNPKLAWKSNHCFLDNTFATMEENFVKSKIYKLSKHMDKNPNFTNCNVANVSWHNQKLAWKSNHCFLDKKLTTMEVIIIKFKIYKLSKDMDYLGFANYIVTNVSQHSPKLVWKSNQCFFDKNLPHWRQFLQNPISINFQNIWIRTHNLQIVK
jgi:hypothetical protein